MLDTLDLLEWYASLGENFQSAIAWVRSVSLRELSVGNHGAPGDPFYAIVMQKQGKNEKDCKLEAHRRYADIQIVLSGTERMGWKPLQSCVRPADEYDSGRDILFFEDEVDTWVTVRPGQFALFLPSDAHLPMISQDVLHKVVVKVEVNV